MEKNKKRVYSLCPPVDAAGELVPLETSYMYDSSNIKHRILSFSFIPSTKKWLVELDDCNFDVNVENMCLTKDGVYKKLKDDIYHLVMSEYLDDPEGDVDRIVDRIKDLVDGHQD